MQVFFFTDIIVLSLCLLLSFLCKIHWFWCHLFMCLIHLIKFILLLFYYYLNILQLILYLYAIKSTFEPYNQLNNVNVTVNEITVQIPSPVESNPDGVECSICLTRMFDSNTLPCGHSFHEKCINTWLNITNCLKTC